jgi:hypothetical protein
MNNLSAVYPDRAKAMARQWQAVVDGFLPQCAALKKR